MLIKAVHGGSVTAGPRLSGARQARQSVAAGRAETPAGRVSPGAGLRARAQAAVPAGATGLLECDRG